MSNSNQVANSHRASVWMRLDGLALESQYGRLFRWTSWWADSEQWWIFNNLVSTPGLHRPTHAQCVRAQHQLVEWWGILSHVVHILVNPSRESHTLNMVEEMSNLYLYSAVKNFERITYILCLSYRGLPYQMDHVQLETLFILCLWADMWLYSSFSLHEMVCITWFIGWTVRCGLL